MMLTAPAAETNTAEANTAEASAAETTATVGEATASEQPVHPRRQRRLDRLQDSAMQGETSREKQRIRRAERRANRRVQGAPASETVNGKQAVAPGAPDKFSQVGDDFQVNSVTAGYQFGSDVARLPTGEFVVVWESTYSAGDDNDGFSISGRVFDANGSPIGDEFQVNSTIGDDQLYPSVAISTTGFVVTWQSYTSSGDDNDGLSIQARRFDLVGNPLGNDFQVNTFTDDYQYEPRVSMNSSGQFIVVWDSFGSPGDDNDGGSIQGRRFAPNGTPLGDQFQVNSFTLDYQYYPDVALTTAGDFLVVWESGESPGTDDSFSSILGRRGLSDGTLPTPDFQINSETLDFQGAPRTATNDQGFVVVWDSYVDFLVLEADVQAQRLDSLGNPIGPEFTANSDLAGYQGGNDVTMTPAGEFTIAWTDYGAYGEGGGERRPDQIAKTNPTLPAIEMRRFGADGAPLGDEFIVSSEDYPDVEGAIASDEIGNIVATWTQFPAFPELPGLDDGSGTSIQGSLWRLDADLQVTLEPQGPASAGGTVVYLLTASNAGPDGVSVTEVTASFDPNLTCTYTSTSNGGASGNGSGSGDVFEVINLPSGGSVVYTITCEVDSGALGDLTANASISARVTDVMPGDETASNVLPVTPPAVPFAVDVPVNDPRALLLLILILATAGITIARR